MTAVPARRMRRLLWTSCALVLAVPALLASCSGNENISYGTAVVTMSDASGSFSGFSSYVVNVDSITLTRSDGLIVEPLAEPETVDLVKLHDQNELVEAPAVPVGTYTSMTLVLDYSAPIVTVDLNGVVTAVSPETTDGVEQVSSTLTVTFDPANQLVITGGVCIRLAIDLNLAASNTIDYATSPPTVTTQPFISATVAPVDQTVLRARGVFVQASPSTNSYIVNMRPFEDLISALGALTVNTSDTTYFNVNGLSYVGAAGLEAMQKNLQVSTPVAAYGTLGDFSTITPTFNATAVYAGTALESPLADYVTGTVSYVNGDNLAIHGAAYLTRLGAPGYFEELPVTVSSATIVTVDGSPVSGLTTNAISVGQLVTVAGQSVADANDNLVIDATAGLVRLQPTPLWATLNSGAAGSMSLNVQSIGGFVPSVFDFAGTGGSTANDAAPADYLVDTGTLDESATPAGTLLETVGLVAPFGSAPPDFTASSVTVGSSLPQTLVVEWINGGAELPFSSASSAGLVVNLSNVNLSSTNRYIATGPQKIDLTTLPASPAIVFASGVPLTLSIGNDSAITTFNTAAGFATQLASTLNLTNAVYRLVCVGQYSSATNTFTATQVSVNLQTG